MKKYIRIECIISSWRHDVEGRPLTNIFDEIEAIMMHYKLAMQYFYYINNTNKQIVFT